MGRTTCNSLIKRLACSSGTSIQTQYLLFLCFRSAFRFSTPTKEAAWPAELMPSCWKSLSGPRPVLDILVGGPASSRSTESMGLLPLLAGE